MKLTQKKSVREQFNKQADTFSKWPMTKNKKLFQYIFDFCKLESEDSLLDIACGSGEFAIFCAKKLKKVYGIDISNEMIKLAKSKAKIDNVTNVKFIISDVETIPYYDGVFNIVCCRSGFHHMRNYNKVFSEMVRCVKEKGKICIQDMIAYNNKKANDFFENMEKKIDISHYKTLSKEELIHLYEMNNIKISKKIETEREFNLNQYMSHAIQTKKNLKRIYKLIYKNLNDSDISRLLYTKNGEIFFKRIGLLIWGIKG